MLFKYSGEFYLDMFHVTQFSNSVDWNSLFHYFKENHCFPPLCTVGFETWHLELITGLVILISSCRYLLLKTWPEFAKSSEAANQQVAPLSFPNCVYTWTDRSFTFIVGGHLSFLLTARYIKLYNEWLRKCLLNLTANSWYELMSPTLFHIHSMLAILVATSLVLIFNCFIELQQYPYFQCRSLLHFNLWIM